MLRRVILFLLVCCLAVPAMAMTGHCASPAVNEPPVAADCHQAIPQAAMDHGNSNHSDKRQSQPPQKDCIGCVTPLAAQPPLLPRLALTSQPHPLRLAATFTPSAAAPETPPPRT